MRGDCSSSGSVCVACETILGMVASIEREIPWSASSMSDAEDLCGYSEASLAACEWRAGVLIMIGISAIIRYGGGDGRFKFQLLSVVVVCNIADACVF